MFRTVFPSIIRSSQDCKYSNRHMSNRYFCLLASKRTLYMFRTVFASIIRSSQDCKYSNRRMSNRYCCLLASKRTFLGTPDDGRKDPPKHVECHSKIKQIWYIGASGWFYYRNNTFFSAVTMVTRTRKNIFFFLQVRHPPYVQWTVIHKIYKIYVVTQLSNKKLLLNDIFHIIFHSYMFRLISMETSSGWAFKKAFYTIPF